jgi:hypothetical protein
MGALMKNKRWYFVVTFENGTKNSEFDLCKTKAKSLYDYHIKNMIVLGVKRATYGQLDD